MTIDRIFNDPWYFTIDLPDDLLALLFEAGGAEPRGGDRAFGAANLGGGALEVARDAGANRILADTDSVEEAAGGGAQRQRERRGEIGGEPAEAQRRHRKLSLSRRPMVRLPPALPALTIATALPFRSSTGPPDIPGIAPPRNRAAPLSDA